MKINDYPEIQNLGESDKMLVETENGTSIIKTKNMVLPTGFSSDNAIVHKTNIRGKNLGDTYTSQQKQAIADGSFDDLYLGDYWEKDGIKWQIVDINYWKDKPNHLVIMPHKSLGLTKYDDRSTTVPRWSGYASSHLRLNYIQSMAYPEIVEVFGNMDNVMGYEMFLINAVDSSNTSEYAYQWYEGCKVEIPYVSQLRGYGVSDCSMKNRYPTDLPQFTYFALNNSMDNNHSSTEQIWIQDIRDGTTLYSYMVGRVFIVMSSLDLKGLRPYFCLY